MDSAVAEQSLMIFADLHSILWRRPIHIYARVRVPLFISFRLEDYTEVKKFKVSCVWFLPMTPCTSLIHQVKIFIEKTGR